MQHFSCNINLCATMLGATINIHGATKLHATFQHTQCNKVACNNVVFNFVAWKIQHTRCNKVAGNSCMQLCCIVYGGLKITDHYLLWHQKNLNRTIVPMKRFMNQPRLLGQLIYQLSRSLRHSKPKSLLARSIYRSLLTQSASRPSTPVTASLGAAFSYFGISSQTSEEEVFVTPSNF